MNAFLNCNDSKTTREFSAPAPQSWRESKIAIIGAGGFVGERFLRILQQYPQVSGVGIVRSAKSLARLSNLPSETRVVDTARASALAEALADCETVINAVNGDVSRVLKETQIAFEAATAARCSLFIHISSAVVFGRALEAGLPDDAQPDTHNWMLYARGKAASEMFLRSAMEARPPMRIVALRPGLIWGPGSQWSSMVGEQLSRGSVCLSNGGRGYANLVYVDNMARSILAIHANAGGPPGFYNVGDPQRITWREYYEELGRRLGYPASHVHTWPTARLPLTPKLAFEWALQQQPLYRTAKWILPRLSPNLKAQAKKILKGEPMPPMPRESVDKDDATSATKASLKGEEHFDNGQLLVSVAQARSSEASMAVPALPAAAPRLTREHWALQNTAHCLPIEKLLKDYSPAHLISLPEALDATAAWLRYAGYGAAGPFDCSALW